MAQMDGPLLSHQAGEMMQNSGAYQRSAQGQQPSQKLGSLDNPRRYHDQDFETLREQHLQRGLLFEDNTFPASESSIGPKLISMLLPRSGHQGLQWKRPGEIQRVPHLIVDGASIFDILQGELGDCWVLSVIGGLTIRQKFLDKVLPKNQGFSQKYAGIFHFRFWQYGDWVDVVIDDKLPFVNGRYMSVQPRSNNEFWPSLLEKAYAKLRGSYENLHWGYIAEALVDFTGGVNMQFSLKNPTPDLSEVVVAAARSGCLAGCTTPGDQIVGNSELENGLVKGHAYTVTSAAEVQYKKRSEYIVQIWNPWGKGEWNGAWSDNSVEWEYVRPEIREKLNMKANDGLFWMSCQDFMKYFAQINICNTKPTYLDFEDPKTPWTKSGSCSRWVKGSTNGGHFNNETFSRNPQYVITVKDEYGSKTEYTVVVVLMQKPRDPEKSKQEMIPIGFVFCRINSKFQAGKDGLPQAFFNQNASEALNTGLIRSREVTQSFKAPPGNYVIVPYTENRGVESDFLLRVFQKSKDLEKELETKVYVNAPKKKIISDICCCARPQTAAYVGRRLLAEEDASYRVAAPNVQDGNGTKTSISTYQNNSNGNMQAQNATPRSAQTPPYRDNSYENIFAQYARPGSELDASQLQRLLNDVVFQDQSFPVTEEGFTLDTCRGILTLMDIKANGRLNLQEFGRLWKRVDMCKTLFREYAENHSRSIDISGLQNAVQAAGLPASSEMLSLMILRYGDSSKRLNFTDFVSSIIRLETVTKVFRNLSKDGKGIYLSGEEWMQIIMSS